MVNNQHKRELVNLYGQLNNEFEHYQFSNDQLFRTNELERKIKGILSLYAGRIDDLIEIMTDPEIAYYQNKEGFKNYTIMHFISEEDRKLVEEALSKEQVATEFYSFDGQKFSTLEEAIARNEEIVMQMDKPKTI